MYWKEKIIQQNVVSLDLNFHGTPFLYHLKFPGQSTFMRSCNHPSAAWCRSSSTPVGNVLMKVGFSSSVLFILPVLFVCLFVLILQVYNPPGFVSQDLRCHRALMCRPCPHSLSPVRGRAVGVGMSFSTASVLGSTKPMASFFKISLICNPNTWLVLVKCDLHLVMPSFWPYLFWT